MKGHTGAYQRLLDMGLTRGTEVEVVNSAPFKGPVEVKVRNTYLALGRGLASKVFVEVEDGLQERFHPHGPHH
jgi:Fe2+ transport system protein FeoA